MMRTVALSPGQEATEPWEPSIRIPAVPLCQYSSQAPCYQLMHPLVFTSSEAKDLALMSALLPIFNKKIENQSFPANLLQSGDYNASQCDMKTLSLSSFRLSHFLVHLSHFQLKLSLNN